MIRSLFRWPLTDHPRNSLQKAPRRRFGRQLRHEPLEDRRVLAVLTVNVAHDDDNVPNNDGELTLREALDYTNLTVIPGPSDRQQIDESDDILGVNDVIVFNLPVGSEIELLHGELEINRSVVIDGSGVNDDLGWRNLTIDASTVTGNTSAIGDGARVFDISLVNTQDESVTLRELSLTGGDTPGNGGAIRANIGQPALMSKGDGSAAAVYRSAA